jgi:hypothetical protein
LVEHPLGKGKVLDSNSSPSSETRRVGRVVMALVLKTSGRKPAWVRILYPPPKLKDVARCALIRYVHKIIYGSLASVFCNRYDLVGTGS